MLCHGSMARPPAHSKLIQFSLLVRTLRRFAIPRAPDPKREAVPARLAMAALERALLQLQQQEQQQQQKQLQQQQQEAAGEADAEVVLEELRGQCVYRLYLVSINPAYGYPFVGQGYLQTLVGEAVPGGLPHLAWRMGAGVQGGTYRDNRSGKNAHPRRGAGGRFIGLSSWGPAWCSLPAGL